MQANGVRLLSWLTSAVLAAALVAGCQERNASQAQTHATATLHPLTIRVHPDHAVVAMRHASASLISVIEQRGPVVSLSLPEGDYAYEVRAEQFESYQGTFSIPHNRNLEVWLTPR
jgi:hypothetical protein